MTTVGTDVTGVSVAANLALIGDELIRFASAPADRFRLFQFGGLLRWVAAT
jgi:hypothetical protein